MKLSGSECLIFGVEQHVEDSSLFWKDLQAGKNDQHAIHSGVPRPMWMQARGSCANDRIGDLRRVLGARAIITCPAKAAHHIHGLPSRGYRQTVPGCEMVVCECAYVFVYHYGGYISSVPSISEWLAAYCRPDASIGK